MLTPEVFVDAEAMSHAAAERIVAQLRRKPNSLLCLASGGTPTRTYELLRDILLAEPALATTLRILKLDEWGGLPAGDPATCEAHLQSLFAELGIGDRYQGFASDPANPSGECRRMREWLDAVGPIDLCVLGLGLNGHLGFNEPGDGLQPYAHIATLSQTSCTHPMLAATEHAPSYGLTLGMHELLQSRQILLLATGAHKRPVLEQLCQPMIRTTFPASFLHLHARTDVLCDAPAAPRFPVDPASVL